MNTEELIVHLAREARPVTPLPKPSIRLVQWTIVAVPLAALGIFAVGPRRDVLDALGNPAYVTLEGATLMTAVLAAAAAFVLSVPGAERSPLQRAAPIAAALAWAIVLVGLLVNGGDAVRGILSPSIHLACIIEIAAFGLLPGWLLFRMLRRGAPLALTWSAALAALAATALGAAATQIVCPIDDPAHHLAGHFLAALLIALVATFATRRELRWIRLA